MHDRNARHTITINGLAFSRLRNKGQFGESYSEVILRLLDEIEKIEREEDTRT
jgi:predicted CopG family antitoxin